MGKRNDKQFAEEREIDKFIPTCSQKQVNNLLRQHQLVFVSGSAGTGKTAGVLHHFCSEYLAQKSKQIVIIRTPVEAGPDRIGFLPGKEDDKIGPHFAAVTKHLKQFLGGKFDADLGRRIHLEIPNFVLGCTWDDSLVMIDEAQQLSPGIMKLLLERLGENSVCAVVGDPTQIYAASGPERDGMAHSERVLFEGRHVSPLIGRYTYSTEDNVRSEISQVVVQAYEDAPHLAHLM